MIMYCTIRYYLTLIHFLQFLYENKHQQKSRCTYFEQLSVHPFCYSQWNIFFVDMTKWKKNFRKEKSFYWRKNECFLRKKKLEDNITIHNFSIVLFLFRLFICFRGYYKCIVIYSFVAGESCSLVCDFYVLNLFNVMGFMFFFLSSVVFCL